MKKNIYLSLLLSLFLCLGFSGAALAQDLNTISYQAHVSDIGWMDPVPNGAEAGTTGMAKHLEALIIETPFDEISCNAHVSNIGWQEPVGNHGMIGTVGQGLPIEAINLNFYGDTALNYDIYYRTHVSNLGWLDWAVNGQTAGTTGLAYPVEAVQIQIVPKGTPAPGPTTRPSTSYDELMRQDQIQYAPYVHQQGWRDMVLNGQETGCLTDLIPLEGLIMTMPSWENSSIRYQVYQEGLGWTGWQENGVQAGSPESGNAIDAFQVQLSGESERFYDIYYRAYSQNCGWLDWTSNGAHAGTVDGSLKLMALQVQLVPKGHEAPGRTYQPLICIPSTPSAGEKCIFVSIPQQMLYYYNEAGNLLFCTKVTTGTPGTKSETPRGRWRITSKQRNVLLYGEDYISHVSIWLPFIGKQYGLHDADEWRSNYGSDTYLYDGSHGCVNIPLPACQTLYNMIPVGVRIVID